MYVLEEDDQVYQVSESGGQEIAKRKQSDVITIRVNVVTEKGTSISMWMDVDRADAKFRWRE